MDFIDIVDVFRVDPDDRDDVEESSSFVIVLGIAEDGVVDVLEEVAHHWVKKILETAVLVLLEADVNGLE